MQEMVDAVSSVLSAVWGLFQNVQVPGLGISFASWQIALLLISISLGLISFVFGFGGGGTGYRSGQSRTKHISDNRKSDEK